MNSIACEVRVAIRTLCRAPRFSLTALLILALSIAPVTLTFSIVDSVLLRSLPYPNSDRLFYLHWQAQSGTLHALSATKFSFLRRHSRTLEEFGATDLASAGVNIAGRGSATYAHALHVSQGFFRTIGVHPLLGRDFLPQEERTGSDRVAILGDSLWRREFRGDPTLLGRSITVNDQSYTVVGVMPPNFVFTPDADVLLPLPNASPSEANENRYAVIARTIAGITQQQAQAEMTSRFEEFRRTYPDQVGPGEHGVRLERYQDWIVGDVKTGLLLIFGAVSMVLLIACVDIGVLLLVRMAHRSGEMAVRAALGARKVHLVRQVMTESLVLAFAGGALGLLAAQWSLPAILSFIPDDLPRAAEIGLNLRTATFSVAAAALSAVLFGLVPACRAAAMNVAEWLKQSAQRTATSLNQVRIGNALLSCQIALSLVLLISAALLFQSLLHLRSVPLGFNPENRLALEIALDGKNYESTAQTCAATQRVLDLIRTLPGVISAASASNQPTEPGLNIPLHFEGDNGDDESVEFRAISPGYFQTMGIPVVAGRDVARSDSADAPLVAIVNETAARFYGRDRRPLGAYLTLGRGLGPALADRPRQVVGIVGDIRESRPDQEALPTVFVPLSQVPDELTSLMNRAFRKSFVIRTERVSGVMAQIRHVVPTELSVASARPMTEVVHNTTAHLRFQAFLMLAFSGCALLLTGVGIFGIVSFQTNQRRHELGIRMSLGAKTFQLLWFMLLQAVLTTTFGVAAGIAGAVAITRVLASMLYGLQPTDPLTFAVASLAITAVALVASYLPVYHVTRGNPIAALRTK